MNIDQNSNSLIASKDIDLSSVGQVVDMNHFDAGTQNVLAYCTTNGNIMGEN